jgi:hypothetical protein
VVAQDATTLDEIVVYVIDADTYELLRYEFVTDSLMSFGVVMTRGGAKLKDLESLTFVPHGSAMGLYSIPTKNPFEGQLVRMDPLSGRAEVVGPRLVPSGTKVTGLISDYDGDADKWYLLGCTGDNVKSDPDRNEPRTLIRIDPMTGASVIVASESELGDGRRFEGLARDAKGDLFAISRTHFYRIHEDAGGYWVEDFGTTGLDKAEALEFVTGDAMAAITVPGVDPTWTEYGILFVFDDTSTSFGVLNPADGSFVEYEVDGWSSALATEDAEGIVVLTYASDPLTGIVKGD